MSQDTNQDTKKMTRIVRALLVLTVVAGGGATWWFLFRQAPIPKELIAVSGRIESDSSTVAAKTSGRIREIAVREGDEVKAGQVIAVLDDDQLQAKVQQAEAEVERAAAKSQSVRLQIAILESSLQQNRLTVGQSRADAEGRVSQARAQVAAAEANQAQADVNFRQARIDGDRFTRLAEQGDAPTRDGEQARTAVEAHRAVVEAAKKQVEAAQGNLTSAKALLDAPAIHSARSESIEREIAQARADVLTAEADHLKARAELQEANADRGDLQITAPFDGVITTRVAEPGEVVAAGSAIVTMIDPRQVYLRAFVAEGEIGRVKTGQRARIYLDSDPGKPLEATVSRIDPNASFTPENTYFRDDRVKQVVGVKLQLINPEGYAKPGMPADGEVLVQGDQWLAQGR